MHPMHSQASPLLKSVTAQKPPLTCLGMRPQATGERTQSRNVASSLFISLQFHAYKDQYMIIFLSLLSKELFTHRKPFPAFLWSIQIPSSYLLLQSGIVTK